MLKCARCQAENREGRRFCAQCGAELAVACKACAFVNEPGEKFCGGCGRELSPPQAKPAPAAPSPQSYTPPHLAQRILTSRSALEGERKQVTVLFADLKGSMELLAGRDPEEARALLDAVLQRMMESVHRYEGTVNQILGDGIMALFGAPLALEEHAVRACHAALEMQKSIGRYAAQSGAPVRIRVGLNSGEVVVRAIGNDLHMDYSAIGQTTHLAARMEQTAVPGTILMTGHTLRLVEDHVEVRALGPVPVKGLDAPVHVFELESSAPARTRLQIASRRGMTPFVGRESQLAILPRALAEAATGRGQVVALVGEAGVGKSRLIWELVHSARARGWAVLEGHAYSFGKATTYLPVTEVLCACLDIGDGDGPETVRERLTQYRLAPDSLLAPLLALMNIPFEDMSWFALDPVRRRQRTLDAVTQLLIARSQVDPLILVFEDLHWIDSESEALLERLRRSIADARILLLVNYRPEYRGPWAAAPGVIEVRIDPLGSESSVELLRALLGTSPSLAPLCDHLIALTQGNPFFLEESVRTLIEIGALAGERGAYRLVQPLTGLRIPGTVQAIVAARIDRLQPELKRLVQSASVVGREVPFELLRDVSDLDSEHLQQGLMQLEAAEFMYPVRSSDEPEYTFKHALTHEVAYASLLQERRRALHGRVLDCLEQRGRIAENVERLAEHAFRGESWTKALDYYRQAGAKALARSAHPEAVTCFERALVALARLPENTTLLAQAVDLRFNLRNSLWPLGQIERLFDHLAEAQRLAESLGDQRRLGQISAYLSQSLVWVGEHERGLEAAERALSIARALHDFSLELIANYRLGQACYSLGDYRRGAAVLRATTASLREDQLLQRFGLTTLPSVLLRDCLLRCVAELGEFDEGVVLAGEAVRIAERVEHSFDLVSACFGASLLYLRRGRPQSAVAFAERARRICDTGHAPAWIPLIDGVLGAAYAALGRLAEALPLLESAVQGHAKMRLMGSHSQLVAWHAEGLRLAGRTEDAATTAEHALALAREYHERGNEAWAHWLRGSIAAQRDLRHADARDAYLEAAHLAEELAMRPLLARIELSLALLQARNGDRSATAQALMRAATRLSEMGMQLPLDEAQAALADLRRLRRPPTGRRG